MNNIRTMNKDLELIKQGKFIPAFSFTEKIEIKTPQLKTKAYTVGPSSLELEMEKLKQKVAVLEKEEKIHSAQQEQIKILETKVKETLGEKEKAEKAKNALEKRIAAAQEKARLQELEAQNKASEAKKKEEETARTKQTQLENLENKLKGLAKEEKQILTEKLEKTAERVAKIAELKNDIFNLEQEKQNILKEEDERIKTLENEKVKIKQEEAKFFEQEIKNLEDAKHKAMLTNVEIERQIVGLHEKVGSLLNQTTPLRPDVSSSFDKEVGTPTLRRGMDEHIMRPTKPKIDELENALLNTPPSTKNKPKFDPYQESLEE